MQDSKKVTISSIDYKQLAIAQVGTPYFWDNPKKPPNLPISPVGLAADPPITALATCESCQSC